MWRDYLEDIVLTQPASATPSKVATAEPKTRANSGKQSDATLATILSTLSDDKAEDIVSIDLRGRSQIADHMVIASGRSTRQVSAMAEKLGDRLKKDFEIFSKTEGQNQGDWVLIDTGDVIVHLFRPEVREFYQLEKMWAPDGPNAD